MRNTRTVPTALSVAVLAVALAASGSATASALPDPPGRDSTDAPDTSAAVEVISLTDASGTTTAAGAAGLAPASSSRLAPNAASGTPAVLTVPTATDTFLVAAVTWRDGENLAEDAHVFIRVLEGGVWSDWLETESDEGAEGGQAVAGTDPFVTGGAEAVQVQVTGPAAELPADLGLTLIPADPSEDAQVSSDPGEAPATLPDADLTAVPMGERTEAALAADPTSEISTPASATAAAASVAAAPGTDAAEPLATTAAATSGVNLPNPGVYTRAQWGADETIMTWRPSYAGLQAAVIHHTAGTNNYTADQSASIIRSIYRYHAITRDWGDIGYNFLVDKFGRIFEGRTGSRTAAPGQMTIGGHARPMNTHTMGVSVMGTYTEAPASSTVLRSVANVIAWQFGRAGLDMTARSGLVSTGTGVVPSGVELPRIFGHRDVAQTACPGLIRTQIDQLSMMVSSQLPNLFYLANEFTTTADVRFRYGQRGANVYVGDWDGDGVDTVATRVNQLFYLTNTNGYSEAATVVAFGRPGDVVLVGDWNGDGRDTFAVRRGNMYYIMNTMGSGTADRVIPYGRATDQVVVGDWDGNGTDTLGVRRGNIYYFRNSLTGGVADREVAYGRNTDVVLTGDWDGNGTDTLAVRRANQYFIANSLSSGPASTVVFYGRATDVVLVGDWNDDGRDTLGVRRL
ncbi:N-acetylmuramoyl-L-alanine amidase [Occultella kanbiaonis]|uniref:N-acetylmuramoyl-L-alanine amidase n=1 Tax=Occultella kanbiaonis TaxID=2675754 RepID=UPI00143E06BF|nr:N-acetylmuramoyl-L-alanine amidase [Occultella kanbiaonis]